MDAANLMTLSSGYILSLLTPVVNDNGFAVTESMNRKLTLA